VTSLRAEVAAAASRLEQAGVDSARYDAEELLAWALGVSRADVATAAFDQGHLQAFRTAVERRALRVPLQHITGSAAFRYLDLEVGPGVFVPRPETEVMTGVAIDELRRLVGDGTAEPVAIDLCTGSGAVALSIATEVPTARVVGVEVSAEAHAYGVRNAARLAPATDIRLGDMAHAVDDLAGLASVVTANPPYIPLDAFETVAAEVRDHDPPVALWSGADGLDSMRVVAEVASRLLVDGGLLVCEHADVQGESAPRLFASAAWRDVRDNRDLLGRPRFVSARRVDRHHRAPGTMSW
jgi:release factor glutamine methyltransferase